MKVKALQGDTVDLLCFRHYGTTQGVTEKVLAANPGLCGQIFLEAGQEVELPEQEEKKHRRRCSYGIRFFRSIYDHIAFAASVSAVTIGAMTISEKIALAGLLLGALSLFQGWLHRRRMERAQVRRNALIAQILAQAGTRGLHESEQRALAALQRDNDEKH